MATPPAVAAIWAISPGPWLGAPIGGATALGGACWTAGWVGGAAGRGAGAAAMGADLRWAGGGEADLPRRGILDVHYFSSKTLLKFTDYTSVLGDAILVKFNSVNLHVFHC